MTNQEVDEKVLAAIGRGVDESFTIQRATFPNPASNAQSIKDMRAVDRSLQRLRRAGKIAYVKRAWMLVKL